MTQRPFPIPTWAPVAAAVAIVVWAASIWWMVATLPTGGDTSAIEGVLDAVVAELESANASIETLGAQLAAVEEERAALVARIEDLESRGPVDAAFQMSTPDGEVAASEAAVESTGDPSDSPFFTNGADRYNCRNFTSMADAQEALEVNRPGDPNRIDGNNNGRACEDFKYPAAATPAATPSVAPAP